MGAELVDKLLQGIKKIGWPAAAEVTQFGLQTYNMALDEVDGYTDDPRVLGQALQTLHTGGSRPLMQAGAAYAILAAARETGGEYAANGRSACLQLLEAAQAQEPELVEINFIEALLYIYSGELDNARLVLDYLLNSASIPYYHLLVTEARYWGEMGDLEQMAEWYAEAAKEADNVPQRVRLYSRMADTYYAADELTAAADNYKKAIHFHPESAELWHKLSVIHWRNEAFEDAEMANEKSLSYGKLAGAQKLAEALKKRKGRTGRLFGR